MERPRPHPTPVSEPFWAGLRREELVLQQCGSCGRWVHYPRVRCPHCLSATLEWHPVDPAGVVYTIATARQPTAPPFAEDVPQVLAVVELRNGVRLSTTLVDVDPDAARSGMLVEPRFEHGDDGITLLRYAPTDTG